jgi:hypothetical protein
MIKKLSMEDDSDSQARSLSSTRQTLIGNDRVPRRKEIAAVNPH